TEATNPVKVYEMLATGRPVVAVGLPELVPIARRGLIRLAATAEQFAAAIDAALREDEPASAAARRAFARRNAWSARPRAMADAIEAIRSPAPCRHSSAGGEEGMDPPSPIDARASPIGSKPWA